VSRTRATVSQAVLNKAFIAQARRLARDMPSGPAAMATLSAQWQFLTGIPPISYLFTAIGFCGCLERKPNPLPS
jgi:hypothetical protein